MDYTVQFKICKAARKRMSGGNAESCPGNVLKSEIFNENMKLNMLSAPFQCLHCGLATMLWLLRGIQFRFPWSITEAQS
ncbi:MAG: hypothetical protein WA956_04235 [Stenotrophomonas sp.]